MNYTNEQIQEMIKSVEKNRDAHKRYNMKRQLLLNKAMEQGIVVSEEEVDNALKKVK
jgi:hypothetical protein